MGDAEILNIGPRERLKRQISGAVSLALAIAGAVALLLFDAPRLFRLALAVPLWMSGLGFFQAREKACVLLAARGARNLDGGVEAVDDEGERAALQRKARRVHVKALAFAAVGTAIALALPDGDGGL